MLPSKILIVFLVVCSLIPLHTTGQEVVFEHFRVGKEAPFNSVYGQILQDHSGYLWLGTDRGLFRYDGWEFRHYPMEAEAKNEDILSYEFGGGDTLWMVNLNKQLLFLSPQADSIQLFAKADSLIPAPFKIAFFNRGALYIGNHISSQTTKYLAIHPYDLIDLRQKREELFDQNFRFRYLNKNGDLYGFYRVNDSISTLCIQKENQNTIVDTFNTNMFKVTSLTYLPHLKKIALNLSSPSRSHLIHFYDIDPPYHHDMISIDQTLLINNILDDPTGLIWLCTQKGLIAYDMNTSSRQKKRLLSHTTANNITRDQEGGYWVGTEKDGLYYLPDLNTVCYDINHSALSSDNINVLLKMKNTLILGTQSSEIIQIKDGVVEPLYNFQNILKGVIGCRAIIPYEDDVIIGLNYNVTYQLDLTQKTILGYQNNKQISSTISMDYFNHQLLHGGVNGVTWNDKYGPSKKKRVLSQKRNNCSKFDRFADIAWIGEIDGLKYYDFKADSLIPFQPQEKTFHHFVTDIKQSKDSLIWLTTADQGVFGVSRDRIHFHFTTADGLLSNSCQKIFIDEDAPYLWVGTEAGVNRIDLQSLEIQSINRADGLMVEDVKDLCRINQSLWVGTPKGLFCLPVKDDYSSHQAPKIHLTRFKIWDQDTALHSHYTLAHHANNLYFEFQGIYFKNQAAINYQYRMLGIDSNWVSTTSSVNLARYPQLQPGSYHFEIMAVSEEGVSSDIHRINITILKAYWETWWFRVFVLSGILGLFYFTFNRIKDRKLKESRYQQRIEQLRADALRTQMNPHFIFNTLNAIQNFLVNNDRMKSIKYLAKFARLIRSIFEYSEYNEITIAEEIRFLENYLELEQLRFAKQVQINIDIDPALRKSTLLVPTLLIQPLLENAFKHGLFHQQQQGLLTFSIQQQQQKIEFIIEDNGIGRVKSNAINRKQKRINPYSSGITIKERIKLINRESPTTLPKIHLETIDLIDKNGQACGTRCVLSIRF